MATVGVKGLKIFNLTTKYCNIHGSLWVTEEKLRHDYETVLLGFGILQRSLKVMVDVGYALGLYILEDSALCGNTPRYQETNQSVSVRESLL